jgi:anti-sigma regulatory factor (Ser/Thr protein kinase)
MYRFSADISALPAILAQLEELCPRSEKAVVQKAVTSIEELFTNSVFHGLRDEGETTDIGLAVSEEDGVLHVRYEDGFGAFDPFQDLEVVSEQAGQSIEQRPVGGLGRLIVRGLADKVSYTRDGGLNRIDLRFKR